MPDQVHSLDDPRIAPYRNLKDRELAREGARFIAEGEQVVRRLLTSDIQVESVLLAHRKADTIAPLVPARVPVWIATDEAVEQIIGFEFHSGVLACGIRPRSKSLPEVLPDTDPQTLVICPKITNVENLGSLLRLAAGFGVTALVLGPQCCDPFFRQSVRVSMGAVFNLPIARIDDERAAFADLKQRGFELVATVLSDDAEPLASSRRGTRTALLFGGEAGGLDAAHISACDRRVTIPMRRNTDSLNVAVAAGIFLYHFVDVCRMATP
ncbi:MAG TPA: RNA methyltransferase [Tepidisphaeraceae bacterium]|nr:RNA methyltransferase [Tepidisphaeraceae bacterium]